MIDLRELAKRPMTTDPEEFEKFHKVLMLDAPEGYVPHYFALPPGKKANPPPGWTKTPYPGRLTFEEALAEMKRGSNIAISGTDTDRLGILDVDWEGVGKVTVLIKTLTVVSRKRRGFHHYYWWTDTRKKDNIPAPRETPYGEFRSDFLYVLVPGSYVQSESSHEWFGTQTQLDAMSGEEKEKIRGGNPDFKFYVLPASEIELVGRYTLPEQQKMAELDVEHLPDFFKKIYEENHPLKTPIAEAPKKKKGLWRNDSSRFWDLTFEQLFKGKYDPQVLRGRVEKDRFPSPLHPSATQADTSWSELESKDGEKFVQMRCWGCVASHSPLSALAVLTGLGTCQDMGKSKGKPSKLDLKDKVMVDKMLEYAKKNGILPEDEPAPYKGKKAAEEEPRLTARRVISTVIYTECREDDHHFFARYDQTTKKVEYVDVIVETGEYPYVNPGITFPRRLDTYGTPADLYHELKDAINYAEAQEAKKNEIFALFLLLHGCVNPYARHNLQVHVIGPASKGKGRYVDLALMMGDRARMTTDLTSATGYRLNELLGGGLEILDEVNDEDDTKTEKYIRAKYDPIGTQQRLLDPKSANAIKGFRVSGPTLVAKRTAFQDDANIDRGVVIMCERGQRAFPLELIKRSTYRNLQDKLAMFWVEHYCDETLLPTEEEMMYDPNTENVEPRLRIAQHYFTKLAKIIGGEAVADLIGFVEEQVRVRRELKAVTDEGAVLRALHGLILDRVDGYHHTIDRDDGSHDKVVDTLAIEPGGPGRYIIAITRAFGDGSTEKDMRVIGISWSYIAKLAHLASRREPGRILLPYSVRQAPLKKIAGRPVRTISFRPDRLDEAFQTFVPEYDSEWKKLFLQTTGQRGINGFPSMPSQRDPRGEPAKEENDGAVVPASRAVTEVTEVTIRGSTKFGQKREEDVRQIPPSVVLPTSVTTVTSVTVENAGSSSSDKLATSVRAVAPVKDLLTDLQAQMFNEKVKHLQKKACIGNYEHELAILERSINIVAEIKGNGDKVSAFSLRKDLSAEFSKHPDVAQRLVDGYYPEIVELGSLLNDIRKSGGQP
jgi:hypothetical protein